MFKDMDCTTKYGRAFYNGKEAKEVLNVPVRDIEEEDKRIDEAKDMERDDIQRAEEQLDEEEKNYLNNK